MKKSGPRALLSACGSNSLINYRREERKGYSCYGAPFSGTFIGPTLYGIHTLWGIMKLIPYGTPVCRFPLTYGTPCLTETQKAQDPCPIVV